MAEFKEKMRDIQLCAVRLIHHYYYPPNNH